MLSVAAAALVPVSAARASDNPCRDVALAVAAGVPAQQKQLVGVLCTPSGSAGRPIQLLLHGITYNHRYWAWPTDPERYGYVQHMNTAGYATLRIDRLGAGASDRPAPETVTTGANVSVIHQVVQQLRTGRLGSTWSQVLLVGHSYGSMLAMAEAATYHDVDGLLITGFLHHLDVGTVEMLLGLHPANTEGGRFADLPPGYLTSSPGRRSAFYNTDNADTAIIAEDEATKDTLTDGELATFEETLPLSALVDVPVYVAVGEHDRLWCTVPDDCDATLLDYLALEQTYWPLVPDYRSTVVPGAGHSINMHLNAPTFFGMAENWVASVAQ